jgi:hypothetical protein
MWLVKANTVIRINAPFGKINGPRTVNSGDCSLTDTAPWKPYTTKSDKIYEKEDVYDFVRVHNDVCGDVPSWIRHNIELSKGRDVVIHCDGKYAMVRRDQIEYLD